MQKSKISKSRAKFQISSEFIQVMEILDKKVSLSTMRDVFIALYPEKVELKERIRLCDVCGLTFWAKRKDSQTCSGKCLNIFNVRRFRLK